MADALSDEARAGLERWILTSGSKSDLYAPLSIRPGCLGSEIQAAIERLRDQLRRREASGVHVGKARANLRLVEAVLSDDALRALYRRARASRENGRDPEVDETAHREERRRRRAEIETQAEAARAVAAAREAERLQELKDANSCQDRWEAANLANLHAERRDFELAIAYSERSCDLGGRSAGGLNSLASLLRRGNRLHEAVAVARESVGKEPSIRSNASGWTVLAAAVRGEEGRRTCATILIQRPDDPYALNLAGALAVEDHDFEAAELHFERAARFPTARASAVAQLRALLARYAASGDEAGVARLRRALEGPAA